MKPEEAILIERGNEELENLGIAAATVTLDLPLVVSLIGLVQLGLRHPAAGHTAAGVRTRAFITQLIEDIAPPDGPLRELLMKGFDPDFDVFQ